MKMAAEIPASFDCRATAAVLRSGGSIALAGHAAAVMSVLLISKSQWTECCALLAWCAVVYLALRVRMDAQFFELLADNPAAPFDEWLDAAGLRKNSGPRTIEDRRRGALRLWRALVVAVAIEIALMLAGALRWLP
jgi:hypothetical protein